MSRYVFCSRLDSPFDAWYVCIVYLCGWVSSLVNRFARPPAEIQQSESLLFMQQPCWIYMRRFAAVGVYRITAITTTTTNWFFFSAALNQEFKLGCCPFVFQRPKKVQRMKLLRQC